MKYMYVIYLSEIGQLDKIYKSLRDINIALNAIITIKRKSCIPQKETFIIVLSSTALDCPLSFETGYTCMLNAFCKKQNS